MATNLLTNGQGNQSELTGVAPCLFPRLEPEVNDPGRLQSVEVELESSQRLQDASLEHSELSAQLRTAWALVLRCYTGMEEVCFGYKESSEQNGTDACSIFRLAIDESSSLAGLVRRARDDMAVKFDDHLRTSTSASPGRQLYDTYILLNKAGDLNDQSLLQDEDLSKVSSP